MRHLNFLIVLEPHMFLEEKRKFGIVRRIRKKIANLAITSDKLGLAT